MSVKTKCGEIVERLRKEGYGDDDDIPEQRVMVVIDLIVGGAKITTFRYLTEYLTEKYGLMYCKADEKSTYRFVVPKKTQQAQHRENARESLKKSGVRQ